MQVSRSRCDVMASSATVSSYQELTKAFPQLQK